MCVDPKAAAYTSVTVEHLIAAGALELAGTSGTLSMYLLVL
jgi:hypothetical protein